MTGPNPINKKKKVTFLADEFINLDDFEGINA